MKSCSRQPSRPWYRKPESWHDDLPPFSEMGRPMLYLEGQSESEMALRLLLASETAAVANLGATGPSR
jgi:hypothetical protein